MALFIPLILTIFMVCIQLIKAEYPSFPAVEDSEQQLILKFFQEMNPSQTSAEQITAYLQDQFDTEEFTNAIRSVALALFAPMKYRYDTEPELQDPSLSLSEIIPKLQLLLEPETKPLQLPKLQIISSQENEIISSSQEMIITTDTNAPIAPQITPINIDSIPGRTGLSGSCSNKLCSFYEYGLSCKGIGLGLKKICAKYLVGLIFRCPAFPGNYCYYYYYHLFYFCLILFFILFFKIIIMIIFIMYIL
jgi:hypothetical protein